MKSFALLLSLLCLCMSGCLVPSLHPFYTEATLVAEPNIVGDWAAEDMSWSFAEIEDQTAYRLTVLQDEAAGQFEAHLFKLEDQLYMDLYPEELPKDLPIADFYKFHLLPVHHIMHVFMHDDVMELRFLDLEKMQKLLGAYPQLLQHESIDDVVVLTDTPESIQGFLQTFKDYPALWHEDAFVLSPVPAADPNQND